MAKHATTGRTTTIIVNLAIYRAARRDPAGTGDSTGRRLIALRLPSPRALAHRRRMLAHLATQA
ncbi:MAG: hypothetical protein ABS36_02545 [Acidobacteria bacterium SCN 69-37]|nr:MAG: hypothetical protein ABS36_02545 [Acidobacteria bacterium SCN 69-37]